ncbi:MAG: insulinase family protein [Bacteroidia bacterium]
MKKNLLLIVALIACFNIGFSQTTFLENKIPVDPAIRTGTLPNGMKYYIRKNKKPENRVELRLAVNAGSTAENDEQQGLAHLCEHMCFNGTKNFKKSELVDYLESIGTKFGADLNAYTSFDETVYMLQVPTDTEKFITKGLQILEDWAHNVSFDTVEINKERGVVVEEWRLGQGAQERMQRKVWPIEFKDSRYADRLPIGKKEIIEGCKYETLTSFYHNWYRPDLQAVFIVGDIDVDKMEAMLKKQFSGIPKSKNAQQLKSWPVPDQKEMMVATATDKESPYTIIQLNYKLPAEKTITEGEYRKSIAQQLYNGMINSRLAELQKKADAPFVFAFTGKSSMVRTKDAYQSFAVVKEDGIEKGIKTLVTENERVKKFGFTKGEFERQKKETLRGMETSYNERDKTESKQLIQEYIRNFLNQECIPGIAYEYELYKKYLPTITLEEVNAFAKEWITPNGENLVVTIMAPDKTTLKIPGDDEVKNFVKTAQATPITAYEDKTTNEPLLAVKPTAGKIVSEKNNDTYGITELILSNGVRVFLKPTDFKNDQVMFNAYSFGGSSLASDADYISAEMASYIIGESGVGNFDATALDKMMKGKVVDVGPYIDELHQGFRGNASPADLESMMQLIYLYFTQPRKDETMFTSMMQQQSAMLQNRSSDPMSVFRDTVGYVMASYNYRERPFTLELLKEANLDKIYSFYKDRFADANGFVFTFVGSFDKNKIKPLIENYIGALPATNREDAFKDLGIKPPQGNISKTVLKGTEPKSQVNLFFTGDFNNIRKERLRMIALIKLMSIKLRESLREDKSGVYGVGCNPSMTKYPQGEYKITISFGCAPGNVEMLIKAAMDVIDDVKQKGTDAANMTKVKETLIRERETLLKENSFWLQVISQSAEYNEDVNEIAQYNDWVNALTSDDLKNLANKYFDMKSYKQFVLNPEK